MVEEYDPLKLEEIVLNLKLISKIKQNDKMMVINKTLKVDARPLQSVWRWYTSDNRTDTIFFIEFVINSALDNVSLSKDGVYDENTIKKELLNILSGLDNLGSLVRQSTFWLETIPSRIRCLSRGTRRRSYQ